MTGSATLTLLAPLDGWALALAGVPDAVFAEGMAGDGVAIDPTSGVLHAPCDGEIVPMKDARHAVTVRAAPGVDVLMHVGIDTVGLTGEGFEMLVRAGERVRAGAPLLRFDLERLVRRVPSLVTPVVLAAGGRIVRRVADRRVRVGDVLLEIAIANGASVGSASPEEEEHRPLQVGFAHGLHVRPAAQVAAALKGLQATVTLHFAGRSADARSPVAMMSLGAQRDDVLQARASGPDASAALAALEAIVGKIRCQTPISPPGTLVSDTSAIASAIEGVIASRGLALGRVAYWGGAQIVVAERGEGEAQEAAALERALAAVRARLDALAASAEGERRALLEAHRELVADPALAQAASEWLRRGKGAGYAWRQATRSAASGLGALEDARMRERAGDLRDLEAQVLRVLAGEAPDDERTFAAGTILIADDLPPSAVMAFERGVVAGFATARGGATSHVAILAAAGGIPALVAAGERLLAIPEGTRVVLDAESGCIEVDPPADRVAKLEHMLAQRAAERAADAARAHEPARTRDGVGIRVNANLGSLAEAAPAVREGAEGCGLLRTEFLYLDRRLPPGEDEQADEYQRIATALAGRPLAIRTMDVGGDKPIPYMALPAEDNPALGLRGIRASLAHPGMLRTQVRAILRVRPVGQCRILLPMVTDLAELLAVRAIVESCARELGVAAPAIGAMIETPASALMAEQLATTADFLSIGTNDLAQYALAIDRGHPELARRLDALHPAVLRLIAVVADAARAHGKGVSICGALGGDAEALPILIGLGVHEISAAPALLPGLKRGVRELDAARCRELALEAIEQPGAAEVRELVRGWRR